MIRKVRSMLAILGIAVCMLVPAAPVGAEDVFGGVCDEQAAQQSAACQQDGGDPLVGADGIIARVTNIVAAIAGVLAVIIIIWGGFLYITSGGDSNKLTTARNTIVYAAIGLIVILLAQTIIAFVLSNL